MFARLRGSVRLLGAVLCTSLAVALLGAGVPLSTAPTLVIFPFRQAQGLDPRYGSDYVTKLGGVLKDRAAIKVVMADPATLPVDYLHTTKADEGDYYLTGFIAPPANGSQAVIEQVVSARSGTIVWSSTAHISNVQDILDQGPIVEAALLAYATRGYFTILNPTPKPAAPPPTPAPKKNAIASSGRGGGGAPKPPLPLPNEAYGFSSKPTAPPKVYASANHPSRFVVLTISGKTVPPAIRNYTASSLILALTRYGQTAALGDPDKTEFPLFRGHDICLQTGAGYLVLGSVSAQASDATAGDDLWTDAYLNVVVFDCHSLKIDRSPKPLHGGAFGWKTAIDHATNRAVTNFLLKISTAGHA